VHTGGVRSYNASTPPIRWAYEPACVRVCVYANGVYVCVCAGQSELSCLHCASSSAARAA